jgi:hypothetical protein
MSYGTIPAQFVAQAKVALAQDMPSMQASQTSAFRRTSSSLAAALRHRDRQLDTS